MTSPIPPSSLQIEEIVRAVLRQRGMAGDAETAPAPARPPGTGRVAMLTAKETLEFRDFPLPEIGPDEILLKVEACGICGTDIHCYKNDPFGLIPVVLGHEGTGEVLAVGKNIRMDSVGKPVKPGDKLVTSILETSDACMVAKYNPLKANLCDDLRIYGLLPDSPSHHFNGYFGEYLVIRPGSSFFGVNEMSLKLRVLIEPAAVVCHALERAKNCGATLNFRSRVLVQGCGPIGLMMIACLRTYGVNNIIALDGNDSRLEMARRLGADHTLNYKLFGGIDDLTGAIQGLTKGVGAHFGFQVTGVPAAFSNIFRMVRRGGGVCELGHFVDAGPCAMNPHLDICRKEIVLFGSWAYNSWEYPNAYHFLQRAERIGLPMEALVTHTFPLSRIQEAFEANLRQEGVKIMVQAGA